MFRSHDFYCSYCIRVNRINYDLEKNVQDELNTNKNVSIYNVFKMNNGIILYIALILLCIIFNFQVFS